MARATGRARPARDERRPARSETSGASHRTSETSADERRPAGGARPVARAAGRARSQRFCVTSALKKGHRAASAERAETSAERDQWRELPDERGQRFRATSASRSESVIRGGARGASARGESQTSGAARYERREGVRGRPKAAGRLAQKLPSPALKEAERSGSYNPSDLNTLTGGTVRSGTVQGQ